MAESTKEKRRCKKCGRKRYLNDFPFAQRTNKDGSKSRYRLHSCIVCQRRKRREWRAKNAKDRRAYERQWRKDNPKLAHAHDQKYNASEKGLARKSRYERSHKGKRVQKRYKKRQREKLRSLSANIPVPVLRPFVERMLREVDEYYVSGGHKGAKSKEGPQTVLARMVGVTPEEIHHIVRTDRETKQVKLDVADKLAIYGDFTLEELYERAEEWAFLTGDKWPKGYYRK